MVTVKVTDRHFSDEKTDIDVPLLQYLKLKMTHSICIGNKRKLGWSGELPFYISTCGNHGYFIDYCHGWNKNLECPECLEMELSRNDFTSILSGKHESVANALSLFKNRMPSKVD
jgi:hypothetical protein